MILKIKLLFLRYHQPCGFKNNTVQVNNKTFCSEKHAQKEKRKLEVKKGKKIVKEQRKNEHNGKPKKVVPRKLGDTSSSQNEEDDNQRGDFCFTRVVKLHPIDATKPSTYIDNAESDEVQSQNSSRSENPEESMISQEEQMKDIIIVESETIDVNEHSIQVSVETASSPAASYQGELFDPV